MHCRPHGRKHTIAFWMLVAIADAAMLVSAAGPAVTLTVLAGIALAVGAVIAVRWLPRDRAPARSRVLAATTRSRVLAETTRLVTQRAGMTTEVVARRRA